MTHVTVMILTRDEEMHIARAIASVKPIAARVLVVDSGSTDGTVAAALAAGAEVLVHDWVTHAAQFNWALEQIAGQETWVLRLDADEVVSPALAAQIAAGLPDVDGVYVARQIKFLGEMVRFGGVHDLPTMRLFRNGRGRAEDCWMDEHIVVDGTTASFSGAIIDDNRKPLDWWVAKHNGYASREVVDLIRRRYGTAGRGAMHRGAKRWIKTHIYRHLPTGLRAGGYLFYRYILRGGFRDSAAARRFHLLQGFWYRYLVDAKLAEVENHMARTGVAPTQALAEVLGLHLPSEPEGRP